MIGVATALVALSLWAIIATIEVVQRDGYGRAPDRNPS